MCLRGVLCDGCNRGIGEFREDAEALANAIHYLRGNRLHSVS
jgi:hypothetical protein